MISKILNKLKMVIYIRQLKKDRNHLHLHLYSSIDKKSQFGDYISLNQHTIINDSIIGDFCYFVNARVSKTKMGKFCSVGPNTMIGGLGVHPTGSISTHPVFYSPLKQCGFSFTNKPLFNEFKYTTIGNDVWIGANVVVLDGVNVGDGAVIGTGAIVTSDVEPYAIVGGVPAKIIKYRHDEVLRKVLIASKWWDWPLSDLQVISNEFTQNSAMTLERFETIKRKAQL